VLLHTRRQVCGLPDSGVVHRQVVANGSETTSPEFSPIRISMGNGGAEPGHDTVAQDLVHRALVAVHGLHHDVQCGLQERAGLFGSRSSMSSVEPWMSAKSTVTCLHSPSRSLCAVRIFSAKCLGV
jgi:hypothetical protein